MQQIIMIAQAHHEKGEYHEHEQISSQSCTSCTYFSEDLTMFPQAKSCKNKTVKLVRNLPLIITVFYSCKL